MDKLEMMRTFVAVVQEGAFSKAAEKLEISPQLASKYVSALEQNIRTRLLHRTTRTLTPTEAGHRYVLRCAQVLNDVEEMENDLIDWRQNISGLLSINAPMSFGQRHLPELLVNFQQRYPEIEIKLNLTDQKSDIIAEGVDVALRIGDLKSDTIIAKKISNIRIAVLASPDYLSQQGTPEKLEDLAHHRFLNYSMAAQDQLQGFLGVKASELKIKKSLHANNGDVLLNAAKLGAGVIIQPTFIAYEALQQGSLVRLLPDVKLDSMGLYLIYANRQFLPAKVRAFIDFAASYYGDLPYWDAGLLADEQPQ